MNRIAQSTAHHLPVDPSILGVQARMDAVAQKFADNPRGFAKAWCEALPRDVVGKESWDADWRQNMFVLPPEFKALATADAESIWREIHASPHAIGSEALRPLVHELEAACVVAGISSTLYDTVIHPTRSSVMAYGADASVHYRELDELSAKWAKAVASPNRMVGGYDLERMSVVHHARHTSVCPIAHDHGAVSAIVGARATQIQATAEALAKQAARRVNADDAHAVVEAFAAGMNHTLHAVTDKQLMGVMKALTQHIAQGGSPNKVGNFMTYFREYTNHAPGAFFSDQVRSGFLRGEFDYGLRAAFSARGLDFAKYNGIYEY